MAVIFATALVLGVVYNNASPLGVRRSSKVAVIPVAPASARIPESPANSSVPAPPSARAAHTRTGYYNQTVSVTFTSPGSTTGAAAKSSVLATQASVEKFPELTWAEVKAMLADKKVVLIDARTAANYQSEHIPGAVSLPSSSQSAEITAFLSRYSKQTPFVIYCGSLKCGMSHTLAATLTKDHGCTSIMIMPGGYAEYRAAQSREGGK